MNPKSTRHNLSLVDLSDPKTFPLFLHGLKVDRFRNIQNLDLEFNHPITVISGTNKIGKTSIMAMLACSHVEFQMRNLGTGTFERCTWSRLIKFTKHDTQLDDWTYFVKYKRGSITEGKEGRRLSKTKKWSGIAKRESQIEGRKVVYIDVDRILPAHACSNVLFKNTQDSQATVPVNTRVAEYFEYVFEMNFDLAEIARHQNRSSYRLNNSFTSFNSASGEDVLLAILLDSVQADKKSLILIDELELGLHPKIQRRLADVLMDIALRDDKQFIVTTHSPSLLAAFDRKSRIFIDKTGQGRYKAISGISVNAAFSKMDSEVFPLVNLFCEDTVAARLINKAFDSYKSHDDFEDVHKLFNVIPASAPASQVKENYDVFKRTWGLSKINIGYAAVFDGDKREEYKTVIGSDDKIFFLYSTEAPEKFLLRSFLEENPNDSLQYHLEHTNPHALFTKCVENSVAPTDQEVFETLYANIEKSDAYKAWLIEFKEFIADTRSHFTNKL